jgi:very-short-patch-repair endonuclease
VVLRDSHHHLSGDPAIAVLAAKQHGVVTTAQLIAAGLDRGAIAYRVRRGRLHRVHRGVFLVGHAVSPPLALETAALLSVRPPSFLSHGCALYLWGLVAARPNQIDVTVSGRNPRPRAGVRIHCARRLDRSDVARRHGLPITSPARTFLDVAVDMPSRALEQCLAEALRAGVVRKGQLLAAIDRAPGRRVRALRALLSDGPALTRSEAERRLLDLVRAARLPSPRCNVRVDGYEVDFLWHEQRLVAEVDGYAFHSSRAAFERDRRRDADLQLRGFAVMRVTWRQLVWEPEAVVARLAQGLSSRAWR